MEMDTYAGTAQRSLIPFQSDISYTNIPKEYTQYCGILVHIYTVTLTTVCFMKQSSVKYKLFYIT